MTGPATAEGRNVLAVPDFNLYQVMRPYEDFVDKYDGEAVTRLLMLSPNGEAYDTNASRGLKGYDPNLVAGHPVLLGQRVVLLLPGLSPTPLNSEPYIWKFAWRIRNVFDTRVDEDVRRPWHLPNQGLGIADTTGENPGDRVVVPAVWNSIVYIQDEPVLPSLHAVQHLRAEDIQPGATRDGPPIMPDGSTGVLQQGILPSTAPGYTQPWFTVHEMQAIGDELLIAITRAAGSDPNWDFAGVDAPIAAFLGSDTPDLGAYVSSGVSP
jgi:hypothetical protein